MIRIGFLIYAENSFNFVNTIDAFEKDIHLQVDFLKSFKKQKPISKSLQKNTIFTGSGDSLISSMLAESFSEGMVHAMDPLDLYKNKHLVKSKRVYFVSISGNTITNIKVAKLTKKSIAITSKSDSRLAKASDDVILLDAPTNHVFTAGSITFLESALTCISLVKPLSISKSEEVFKKAKFDAKKSNLSKKVYVLGNLLTFPIAMFCAAKFYEVLGYDVHYSRIEQFSHMELFSAKRSDTVIIFEEKNTHNRQLAKNLARVGINVIHPNLPSGKIPQLLYCIFFSEFLALYEAKKKHKKDCHFVTAKKIRNVSNQMIY
ncbi:hypothetical protein Nmar_0747 [Nitrosopumilus maritimus SCM1]|uniref:Sugar isomerase (SIS) n=1 Tax=Nitrosopumilus maritimus (strain SCM1) TaxID=436308 RepID=A9A4F4_NITMS|nr:hypothetical protein Nmar_0747 [Nitrosopumilus maritimus SCM1]